MIVQQERSEREKFSLQIRIELTNLFQAEVEKLEKRYAQVATVSKAKQLPLVEAMDD